MKRRLLAALLLAAVIIAAAILRHSPAIRRAPAATATTVAAEPPQTVSTIIAERQDWRAHLDATGNLRAERGADLAAETAGIVDAISFRSGDEVKAGTILLRLRLNDEPGRLAQLKAASDLAAINLARDGREAAAQAVSRSIVDADHATLDADRAQVVAEQALIDEKTVRAPFDGRLGLRQVDLGQYLPSGTAIVTLQSLDPIYADFYLPQGELAGIANGDVAHVTVDTFPGRDFAGRIVAIAPRVDQASRTAQVRALVDNHDHALLPGMFALIRLDAGAVAHRVTLPQAAITYATYGSTVFVLARGRGGALMAHQALVTLGDTRGEQVAITSGLRGGETVVTAGQLKLHEGTPVIVNNAVAVDASADPHPAEE